MPKKLIPIFLAFFLGLPACLPQSRTDHDAAYRARVGHYMDSQDEAMRQALASSDAAEVQRQGNRLSVVFKGDIAFDNSSVLVRQDLYTDLDSVADVLNRYPQTQIKVAGHTDSAGPEDHNLDLSRQRAEAMRDLLVQRNVSSYRIAVVGCGAAYPVATNETEAGRRMNRRIELQIDPTEQAGGATTAN